MKTDIEIRCEGLKALLESLGDVDAERFIALISREQFDYTQWQRKLWTTLRVGELSELAQKWCEDEEMRGREG